MVIRRKRRKNPGGARRRRRAAMYTPVRKNRKRRRRARRNTWYERAPARRHRKAAKKGWRRRRRNPCGSYRKNPMIRYNRKRRSYRRNPRVTLRSVFNIRKMMDIAALGGGVVLGYVAFPMIYNTLPEEFRVNQRRFLGLGNLTLGIVGAMFIRNAQMKRLATGFAASGAIDLIAQNVPQLIKLALPTDPLFGPSGASASYQTAITPVSHGAMAASYASYPTGGLTTPGMGASYSAPGAMTSGLGMDDDNPYEGIFE